MPEIFMPLARVGLNFVEPEAPEKARIEFRFSSNYDLDIKTKSEIRVRKIDILIERESHLQVRQLIEVHKNLQRIRTEYKSGGQKKL